MSLVKSTATIGFFTLISRVTGFLRDVMMANLIGASWLSDAFFVAFKLPNFFRRIFAEGAFNAAFVPSFSSALTADGRKEALQFAGDVMSMLLLVLLGLNALFIVFMPWILPFFAPGFVGEVEKFSLTVTLAQICFPYILFISLVSLLGGVLNSVGKFAAPAASPILLNLCMIGGMLWLVERSETPAHALAWSVFVAGWVQLIWLAAICLRHNAMPPLMRPVITRRVKQMLLLMAPAALGSGVQQLNLLIDVIIASHIPDAVSYLYYADRITELPIGIIGVAVGTALLPMLSRQIAAGDHDAARASMNRALELVLLFGLPATAACIVIAEPIIRVLYLHGAFTFEDMHEVVPTLVAFAVGLPAFLAVKIFAPGFFAAKDTKTPLKIALICVAVNLVLNLTLSRPFAQVGMAIATTTASWLNLVLMIRILHRRGLFKPDNPLILRTRKIIAATGVMTLVLLPTNQLLLSYYERDGVIRSLTLGFVVLLGMGVYGAMILAFKAYEPAMLKKLFRPAR